MSLVVGGVMIRPGSGHLHDTHPAIYTSFDMETQVTDANGNMTRRVVGGQTYNLSYDAENRLVGVSGAATATFVYDGDGKRVKATIGGTTTVYIGNYYEWTGSTGTMVKYYYAGGSAWP
jgi:YD repeat-containing protein